MTIIHPGPGPASQARQRRGAGFWALVVGVPVVLGLACLSSWTQRYEPLPQAPPAVQPAQAGPEKSVIALAWVDPARLQQGGRFRLWLTLENRSESAALDLRFLAIETPGFHAVSCWAAGGPACRPQGPGKPAVLGLPQRIEKGGVVSVFGLLEPSGESRVFGASGVFSWRDEKGTSWENALLLRPVPVSSPGERFLLGIGRFVLFLKDLLIPAAIACFGWFLKNLDDARQQRERQREARQDRRAREQARIDDTWRLMLLKVHAYAEQHYLPVIAAVHEFIDAVGEVGPDATLEKWHHLLWRWLRLRRRILYLGESIGGLFFRDRQGETLAAECWDRFGESARGALGTPDQNRALTSFALDETFAQFLDLLPEVPSAPQSETYEALTGLLRSLRRWWESGELQRNLPLIQLFVLILDYEVNRPYELWYQEPARLATTQFCVGLERLEHKHQDLRKQLEDYLEAAKRRLTTMAEEEAETG